MSALVAMGLFSVGCRVENQADRNRYVDVPRVLVDTGSELTWIRGDRLADIGIDREKNLRFVMANGTNIARSVGFAVIRVGKSFTVDEVVFAERDDLELLGARTLEGLNLKVDSRSKELVAAGPTVAAVSVRQV